MSGRPAFGQLTTHRARQTRDLGRRLGRHARAGTVIALIGPLGAGKTQLAKGLAAGLGVRSVVNSPTFIIVNEHAGRLPLFHADAYRLTDGEEARAAGLFDERQVDGVTVVEWADLIASWLPAERLEIELEPEADEPDGRTLRWCAYGRAHMDLAERAFRTQKESAA